MKANKKHASPDGPWRRRGEHDQHGNGTCASINRGFSQTLSQQELAIFLRHSILLLHARSITTVRWAANVRDCTRRAAPYGLRLRFTLFPSCRLFWAVTLISFSSRRPCWTRGSSEARKGRVTKKKRKKKLRSNQQRLLADLALGPV